MNKIFAFFAAVTMTVMSAASAFADAATNKELVINFYEQALVNEDVEAAAMKYLAEDYIQHNPNVPTGRDGFIKGLKGWFSAVDTEFSIVRAIAEDDLVVLHVKLIDNGKTKSVMDIFRVENGKIAEHWDVIQSVPEKMAHDNGMF